MKYDNDLKNMLPKINSSYNAYRVFESGTSVLHTHSNQLPIKISACSGNVIKDVVGNLFLDISLVGSAFGFGTEIHSAAFIRDFLSGQRNLVSNEQSILSQNSLRRQHPNSRFVYCASRSSARDQIAYILRLEKRERKLINVEFGEKIRISTYESIMEFSDHLSAYEILVELISNFNKYVLWFQFRPTSHHIKFFDFVSFGRIIEKQDILCAIDETELTLGGNAKLHLSDALGLCPQILAVADGFGEFELAAVIIDEDIKNLQLSLNSNVTITARRYFETTVSKLLDIELNLEQEKHLRLTSILNKLQADNSAWLDTYSFGSIGIVTSKDPNITSLLFRQACFSRGLIVRVVDELSIGLCLTASVTLHHLDEVENILRHVIELLKKSRNVL